MFNGLTLVKSVKTTFYVIFVFFDQKSQVVANFVPKIPLSSPIFRIPANIRPRLIGNRVPYLRAYALRHMGRCWPNLESKLAKYLRNPGFGSIFGPFWPNWRKTPQKDDLELLILCENGLPINAKIGPEIDQLWPKMAKIGQNMDLAF
jgi:hypothetical protein